MKKIGGWLIILLVGFLFTLTPLTYSQSAPGKDPADQARQLLQDIPKLKGGELWNKVNEIEKLGKEVLPAAEAGLKDLQPTVRMACAKVCYTFGNKAEGVTSLLVMLREEKSAEIQQSAAELLADLVRDDSGYGDKDEVAKKITERLDNIMEPFVRLQLDRALFYVNHSITPVSDLDDLLKLGELRAANGDLKYPGLRPAAALALAELGYFEKVKDVLKEIARQPTEQGRLAQTLLDYQQLYNDYERISAPQGRSKYDYRILDEMFDLIKEMYVDPKKFNPKDLITAAAKGVAGSLDRFSAYYTEEEKKAADEDLNKRYGGIGAYVSMRDDLLTIERPIYSGPAYKAGLRSLDKITEVASESTRGKNIDDLIRKLKGEPGTAVKIKVYRKGWTKEKDYTLTRAIIEIKTARYVILPGDIGLLSIITFGQSTAQEVAGALKAMKEASVKSIIIDVRKDPGGLLDAVLNILDMFLESDKVLLTTKDKNGTVLEEFRTRHKDSIDLPMSVLVDSGSASASEILSGVLQDYHKAKLIGERTFGKGSVQRIMDLKKSTDGKAAFRITIARYYLPSGRCIHKEDGQEGGLEPDIKITESDRDPWKDYAFGKIYDSELLNKYGETYYEENKELFAKLADDDGLDASRYPGFADFYKELKDKLQIHLSESDVREALRDYIRRCVADEKGEEFLVDIQTDQQLQRSIIEALKELKVNPESISLYKAFAHKFDKTEETAK